MTFQTNVFELIWVILSIVSAIVIVVQLASAVRRANVVDPHNWRRMNRARSHVRSEQFRLAKVSLTIVGSMVAVFYAPPPPNYLELPQSFVGVLCWIVLNAIFIIESLVERSSQKEYYDEEKAKDSIEAAKTHVHIREGESPQHHRRSSDGARSQNERSGDS